MTEGQPLNRDIGRVADTFRGLGASRAVFACPHVCEASRPVCEPASEVVIEDRDISMLCGDPDCRELPPDLAALGRGSRKTPIRPSWARPGTAGRSCGRRRTCRGALSHWRSHDA